jgi:diketogulonate reductase-like aldo/keto reductase
MEGLFMLLQKGKARAIGVSNYTIGDLQEILKNSKDDDSILVPPVNQVEFQLFLYHPVKK